MVWEHVEGREVGEWLHEEGPFPVPLAIELGIQTLRGLEAIHSLGVIHRDISPDNLMITRDRRGRLRMKIIDLGLARTLAPDPNYDITQAGTFMGKLRYCSPEQAESAGGEHLDRRSDLYSFALVLYEMICVATPFDNGDRPVFVFQRLSQDPKPMVGRNPGIQVPVALDRVVMRALARDRNRRFPDAVRFIEALEQVARGLGDLATQRVEVAAEPGSQAPRPRATGAHPLDRGSRSGELSPDERRALLQQIDRAAKRVRESTQVVERAELAIREGRLEEARKLVADLDETSSSARRLPALRKRLADAEEVATRGGRVAELEQLLSGYLKNKQLPLAQLAFDSLLELDPNLRRQGDFASWIDLLRQELEQDKQVEEALAAGRAALERDDLRAARKSLDAVRKADPTGERAAAFEEEIERTQQARKASAEQDGRRERFAAHLAAGKVDEAEAELAALERLGATRVSVDQLRGRLAEARRSAAAGSRAAELERRFHDRLAAGDFAGARDAALTLERDLPASPRPAELFAEVAGREQEHRRRQAIEQGEQQVADLIRQKKADQAALALRILLRIDPKNRHRKQYERQIEALAK